MASPQPALKRQIPLPSRALSPANIRAKKKHCGKSVKRRSEIWSHKINRLGDADCIRQHVRKRVENGRAALRCSLLLDLPGECSYDDGFFVSRNFPEILTSADVKFVGRWIEQEDGHRPKPATRTLKL